MIKKAKEMILDQDQFAFAPESNLGFNKKGAYSTYPGGVTSISLTLIFTWAWYSQLNLMYNYLANIITTATTAADFEEIGTLKLSDMQTIPFYGFEYENVQIKRTDPVLCKDFGGDCE